MTNATPLIDDNIAKRNVAVLVLIQATIGAMIPVHFLLGGLAGKDLASNVALATLPISMTIIGGMVSAPLLSNFMTKFGRIYGFVGATLIATIGSLVAAAGINANSFAVLCLGAFLIGFYMSAQGLFRFAATDVATPEFKPRAISFSLVGGLIAPIWGLTMANTYSVPNIATPYYIVAAISLVVTGAYFFLRLPHVRPQKNAIKTSIGPILRNRQVIAAMLVAITSYAMMNLMMTSTPLAIEGCGFGRAESSSVVRAHVIAMFLPSFFTGYIIKWIGLRPVVFIGVGILIAASLVALMGAQLHHFYGALILVGVGWNFGFIGGTAMLTAAVSDPTAAKRLQGVNDTVMWSFVALASLSSGVLMNVVGDGGQLGWNYVNYAMLPILIVAGGVGLWLSRS